MPIEITPRNTARGRPRTSGDFQCARCDRAASKARIKWPEGRICGICFHHAMRTHGTCPTCAQQRKLPGLSNDRSPICAPCAGIPVLTCVLCGQEAEHYREDTCARCALKDDLHNLLLPSAADPDTMQRLVDVLAAADRPESVLARIRTPTNQDLLRRLGTGDLAVSHAALDAEPPSNSVEHLRSILEHAAFLEKRDHHLALFERWLETKLDTITDPQVRQPVEQFARWHHLRRIRMESTPGTGSRGRVHAAKQEITEPLKFLTWLHNEHGRYLPDCTQEDVDQYLVPRI